MLNNVIAVGKTWTANGSCYLTIPRAIAGKHRIFDSKVQIAETEDGLLIMRLD
jgi:hypothetical protein